MEIVQQIHVLATKVHENGPKQILIWSGGLDSFFMYPI